LALAWGAFRNPEWARYEAVEPAPRWSAFALSLGSAAAILVATTVAVMAFGAGLAPDATASAAAARAVAALPNWVASLAIGSGIACVLLALAAIASGVRPLWGWLGWLAAGATWCCLAAFPALALGSFALERAAELGHVEAITLLASTVRGGAVLLTLGGGSALAALGVVTLITNALGREGVAVRLPRTLARALRRGGVAGRLTRHLARALRVESGLLSDYGVLRWLQALFPGERSVRGKGGIGTGHVSLVLTATPLERGAIGRKTNQKSASLERSVYQVRAQPDAPLLDALRACVALTPFFEPVEANPLHWAGVDRNYAAKERPLHLIDGASVRTNPLPALFEFLQGQAGRDETAEFRQGRDGGGEIGRRWRKAWEDAGRDDAGLPRVRVVYGVPIEPRGDESAAVRDEDADVVGVVQLALKLARRRDTRLEVEQARALTRAMRYAKAPDPKGAAPVPVAVDEIAPAFDLSIGNPFSPSAVTLQGHAAHGCKRALEVLYADKIRELAAGEGGKGVPCAALLSAVAPRRGTLAGCPGLRELCSACAGKLEGAPYKEDRPPEAKLFVDALRAESGGEHRPRIALIASGGVFRGSFHVGMVAALSRHGVRPDLVVGASVGSLLGSAMAAVATPEGVGRERVLKQLMDAFLGVDARIALTLPLRTALRELGVRASSIDLSPRDVRRMLREGTRHDAGFAAAGAPPALVDAFSTALLLSRQTTEHIARQLISGRIAAALDLLWRGLRRETLVRLGVRDAIMGTSLLRPTVEKILDGFELRSRQPFARRGGPWFFMTATEIGRQRGAKLGADNDYPGAPADFVAGLLASSAFPAVFSPPRESDVYPGVGARDVRLSDGGMFDNLPFEPALLLLGALQRSETAPDLSKRVEARRGQRHLFIAGALDVDIYAAGASDFPADEGHVAWSLGEIGERTAQIQANVKLRGLGWSSQTLHSILEAADPNALQNAAKAGQAREIDGLVDAELLAIYPHAPTHLNGTFAFAHSLGLRE
ncbi:MAG TPA: patatin-like phospholipase family protein, partial [Polyangiaceae bacterium]|nr:patatin-like phospholipase family protein [Polyangiaceae bacterium]